MTTKDFVTNPALLDPLDAKGVLQVVVDTPKGSRNKYVWDGERSCFVLKKILPAGMSFPYDFGFLPQTLGEDGAEIDVLLLIEESCFPGCVVPARLIGSIELEDQLPDGSKRRNDRLLAVAVASEEFANIRHVDDLPKRLLYQICTFFETYPRIQRTKNSRVLGVTGPMEALQQLETNRTPH